MTIAIAAPNFRVQMSTISGEIPESEGSIVQVHEASSTRFRVTRDNGFTEQYDGNFSAFAGGLSGTINTYTLSLNGAVLLTITGANAPINQGQITPAVAFFAGDDRLEGSDLDDQMVAFNGNDALFGKAGNDILIGGLGADTLAGGAGADTLTGGSGADSFAFDLTALSDGAAGILDRVTDLERSADRIDVSLITSAAQAAGALVRVTVDAANGFATLQVDRDGTGSAFGWTSIARLDGISVGDSLSVLLAGGPATITVGVATVNQAPVVAAGPVNALRGQLLAATSLFSASDPDGDALVQFRLYDANPDPASGSFMIDGVAQPAGQLLTLNAAELAQTSFQAGIGAGDDLWVAVSDGTQWSVGRSFTVTPINAGTLGTDGVDVLRGGPGSDALYGANGNDFVFGDGGNDLVFGNAGIDYIDGGAGDDFVDGGDGTDSLFGSGGGDHMLGGAGDDALFGGEGNDVMTGGAGNDAMNGADGDDLMSGSIGSDQMVGGSGVDSLYGRSGDDGLYGGDGNDRLEGGAGVDGLWGGAGSDGFVFDVGSGDLDVIFDGEFGSGPGDLVVIRGAGFGDFASMMANAYESGGTTVIPFSNTSGIFIVGYAIAQLSSDDFAFI
jgi:Ca2+-binding RTX toxin-like protein